MTWHPLPRLTSLVAVVTVLMACVGVSAQDSMHLLHEEPLVDGGRVSAKGGRFVEGGGWQAVEPMDHLIVELPLAARDRSAFEMDVRNFNPPQQIDAPENHIFGIRESLRISGGDVNLPHGDYLLLFAGKKYPQFKVKYHTHGFGRHEGTVTALESFDPDHTYRIRVEWAERRLTAAIDGRVFYERTTPQIDPFDRIAYIQLGSPGRHEALRGPIYSNLRVYTAEPVNRQAPLDLIAPEQTIQQVLLQWQAPREPAGLAHYQVLRNGQAIGRVGVGERTHYADVAPPQGRHRYTVRAVYADGRDLAAPQEADVYVVHEEVTAKRTASLQIDGQLDEPAWTLANPVFRVLHGRPNNQVHFGALWNEEYLVIGVRVLDDKLVKDSTNPREDDAVEIVIDGNNNARRRVVDGARVGGQWSDRVFDAHDWQIVQRWDEPPLHIRKGRDPLTPIEQTAFAGRVRHAWAPLPGGYAVEVAIPWEAMGLTPAPGLSVGVDIRQYDDDQADSRPGVVVWRSTFESSTVASGYGQLILGD